MTKLTLALILPLLIHLSSFKVIFLKCESDLNWNALRKSMFLEWYKGRNSVIWRLLPFFQRSSAFPFAFTRIAAFRSPNLTCSVRPFSCIISSWNIPTLPPCECILQFKCSFLSDAFSGALQEVCCYNSMYPLPSSINIIAVCYNYLESPNPARMWALDGQYLTCIVSDKYIVPALIPRA